MNDRIKQLMEQAEDPEHGFIIPEKFAELIINESIKVMMANDYHGEWLGEKIKEHFGVEE
jgi:hypothetical protein